MTTADDIRHRLAQAETMGWGPARSAQVAEAAAWSLDVDDLGLRADAHLALADAYAYGNEGWKAMARPLHCMLWCLERMGDTDGCRAVIARIRRVYAAPRWKDQGPLRYAAVVERRLEGGEL